MDNVVYCEFSNIKQVEIIDNLLKKAGASGDNLPLNVYEKYKEIGRGIGKEISEEKKFCMAILYSTGERMAEGIFPTYYRKYIYKYDKTPKVTPKTMAKIIEMLIYATKPNAVVFNY